MTDDLYVEIWRNIQYGQTPLQPTKEEIEVLKKDFEGSKDYIPDPNQEAIEIYFCLN